MQSHELRHAPRFTKDYPVTCVDDLRAVPFGDLLFWPLHEVTRLENRCVALGIEPGNSLDVTLLSAGITEMFPAFWIRRCTVLLDARKAALNALLDARTNAKALGTWRGK